MDADLFAQMLSDECITDFKKLHYKFKTADMDEFFSILNSYFYKQLPLKDFSGKPAIWLEDTAKLNYRLTKLMIKGTEPAPGQNAKAMEDEIVSTLSIEDIKTSHSSVRRILAGYAPSNADESRIGGMKKGLEFISDPANAITEENLYRLYEISIADFLPEEAKLLPGNRYRHSHVYIVGSEIEHTGLPWQKLPEYMAGLISFINADDGMNELMKAAVIHFYFSYLHPYFDGNGRMARFLHLWYLVQQGYDSAAYIPLSSYIHNSLSKYYKAYKLTEDNQKISGQLDVTPFVVYFVNNVYTHAELALPSAGINTIYKNALADGLVTEKEKELWHFVLTQYGDLPFSTKNIERDFGNAAYATIRGFVLKFEKLGLLKSDHYSNRVKYRIQS